MNGTPPPQRPSTPPGASAPVNPNAPARVLEVKLPAGGKLPLQSVQEVEQWEEASKRYQEDYGLTKTNDLVLLGAILTQQLALYRAQVKLAGMEPEFDSQGAPTGRYIKVKVKESEAATARSTVEKAAIEIRNIEKSLGVDKKTREAGGAATVGNYITTLKKKAHAYGVHLSNRLKEYERVMMELRWKLRLLENGDAEDLREHNLTEANLIEWLRGEVQVLEEADRKWANEKGKVFVGKL